MPKKLCFLMMLTLALSGAAFAAPNDASLAGTVKDNQGNAVWGAIVRAQNSDGAATVGLTDKNGSFQFPIGAGKYEFSASRKGFRTSASKTLEVNAPLKGLNLVLEPVDAIPVTQLSTSDIRPLLPDVPERAAFLSSCSNCHGYGIIFARGRTRDEWQRVINLMSTFSYDSIRPTTPGTERFSPAILEYLSKYMGPDTKLPEELGRTVKKNYSPVLPLGNDLVYTEYPIPTRAAEPHTAVPDKAGSVWFSEYHGGKVGRLERATGKITEYPLSTPDTGPHGITVGPDGMVWFTMMPKGIGRIDPRTGKMDEFLTPKNEKGLYTGAHTIIVAHDGKVWFTELVNGSISSFDPTTRKFKRYPLEEGTSAYGILEHGDNIFWYMLVRGSKVGTLNANTGEMKSFDMPTRNATPQRFRFDSKGRIWFGEYGAGKLGMFDPATTKMREYELPYRASPYCVHVDKKGFVWAASFDRDSLLRFNPDTQETVEYPLPGAGAIVRDIWTDEQGNWWFVQWGRNYVTRVQQLDKAPAGRVSASRGRQP